MAGETSVSKPEEAINVELRNPWIALFLAWVIPGGGHFYQRRYAKAILFTTCILGTYVFGMAMGGARVVYASLPDQDRRLHYFAQVLVGTPALPALFQKRLVLDGKEPLWGGAMAPPRYHPSANPAHNVDELSDWHGKYPIGFEMGTLFTVVAGLLNVLAMYDAFAGPAFPAEEDADKPPPDGDSNVPNQPDKPDRSAHAKKGKRKA